MFDIITIGDTTFDTFLVLEDNTSQVMLKKNKKELCLNFADKICIEKLIQSVGGNAANIAVATRKLGFKSAIITELGDDLTGEIISQELRTAGVHTELIKMHKKKETRYSVILNYKSERTILSYHAKRTYALPKKLDAPWIYFTSMGTSFETVQKKLQLYLKKHPATKLAVNPGSYQMKAGLKAVKKLFPQTDILFVNKEEADKIIGRMLPVKQSLFALHKMGARIAVITDSTHGSYASDADHAYFMKAYPITPVARTGAGDAYASGFLGAVMTGHTISTAMQWGTANAGGVIQQFGAQRGLQTKAGLQKIIKKYRRVKPVAI